MSLSIDDLEVLQGATLDLHEVRDLEGLRGATARILLGAIPADHLVWLEFGFKPMTATMRKIVLWESRPRMSPAQLKRLTSLLDQHPFAIHGRETGDWGPVRLSDFWSRRQQLASPIYREVYRPLGVERLLACASFRGNRTGTMNISRTRADRDFSERDRLMLRLLMPHFAQALRAAEKLTARQNTLAAGLPTLGFTQRELEVALWLARGRTNPEIARILAMSQRTVEKHVERILIKLGVENRTTAARLIAGTVSLGEQGFPEPGTARVKHWMKEKPAI